MQRLSTIIRVFLPVMVVVASMLPVKDAAATAVTGSTAGPFVTILLSRTEITAAVDCVPSDAGVARLDTTVAPYLASLGMLGTGTLVTGMTADAKETCTHYGSSLTSSWAEATALARNYGWKFVSHTATYPSDLAQLSASESYDETCGSAKAIVAHGLPGGHGLIAYPGAQPSPTALQANYGAKCFAWGRQYGGNATTSYTAGATPPYWQHTGAPNGGPCNDPTQPCYTVKATGSSRYALPSRMITKVRALTRGQWLAVQSYILVTGISPPNSTAQWNCTSADPALHWTTDNERYCYRDWKSIIAAIAAVPNVRVTDPLTVGIAFGRPAHYPS